MWKRERTERVSLDQAMAEPKKPIVDYSVPAPAPAPAVTPQPPPPPAAVTPKVDAAPRPAAPAPAPSTHAKVSVLGPSIRFKGELIADEDLVIQGQVEGSILHTRSLTIGAQGRVQGDVKARRINVEGTVQGDLYALEGVTLRQGALVTGNVFANKISIAEGARLNGRVDMDKAPTVPNLARKGGDADGTTSIADLSDTEVSAVLQPGSRNQSGT